MGKKFKKVRNVIIDNAQIVRTTLRASTALFLHGNPQYADDISENLTPIIKMLQEESIDTEDVLHEKIQDAFNLIARGKPVYVKAAISDIIDTMFMLASRKIEFDEDKLLSPSEREAWVIILKGIVEIAKMVKEQESITSA